MKKIVLWILLLSIIVFATIGAGCTSTPSTPTAVPTATPTIRTTAPTTVQTVAPTQAAASTSGYQDTEFFAAFENSTTKLTPILMKVGTHMQNQDYAALSSSGAEMSSTASQEYDKIQAFTVSDRYKSTQTNYLSALNGYGMAGDEISKGAIAVKSGNMEQALSFFNDATVDIQSGNEYLNLTLASLQP